MKKLTIILVLLFAVSFVNAQKIEFTKTTHDLGKIKVKKDTKIKKTLEFTNTGDKPLLIKSIKAPKGITVKYPKKAIAPGEKGSISYVFDGHSYVFDGHSYVYGENQKNPKGNFGSFSETLTVTTNAATNQVVTLDIKGITIDAESTAKEIEK